MSYLKIICFFYLVLVSSSFASENKPVKVVGFLDEKDGTYFLYENSKNKKSYIPIKKGTNSEVSNNIKLLKGKSVYIEGLVVIENKEVGESKKNIVFIEPDLIKEFDIYKSSVNYENMSSVKPEQKYSTNSGHKNGVTIDLPEGVTTTALILSGAIMTGVVAHELLSKDKVKKKWV